MDKIKTCSFFGDENINFDGGQISEISEFIENLIAKNGINRFLFGRDNFSLVCQKIVGRLQKKYAVSHEFCDEKYEAVIDKSDYCVFCFDNRYVPLALTTFTTKSEMELAYSHAKSGKKVVFNIFDLA